MQGMNMDGVVYVDLALNMSNGIGTMWDPSLMPHFFHHFREHPALGIYLQSLAFRLLGESVYVEKIYCFILACTLFLYIYKIWKLTCADEINLTLSFCFIYLLWTVCPMSGWVGLGNYLEVPLAVCTTLASFYIIKGLLENKIYGYFCLGATLVTAAFFINGPVAFFPIAIPILYCLVFRKNPLAQSLLQSIFLLTIVSGCIAAVLLYPPARLNTMEYFNSQVLASLSGARDPVNTGIKHLMGLLYIATQFYIAIPTAIVLIMWSARSNRESFRNAFLNQLSNPWTRFFLLLALSASLPILLSARQTAHYFYPSLPFYLLMFSHVLLPHFHKGYARLRTWGTAYNITLSAGGVLLLLVLIFTIQSSGEVLDDHSKHIDDLATINAAVPLGDSLALDDNSDSAFIFNFYRYYRRITLTQTKGLYYLRDRGREPAPDGYEEIELGLKYFRLFKRV